MKNNTYKSGTALCDWLRKNPGRIVVNNAGEEVMFHRHNNSFSFRHGEHTPWECIESIREKYKPKYGTWGVAMPDSPSEESQSALDKQVGGNHYKQFAIQPVEFIRKNKIGFVEGNAIKYICRHKLKDGKKDIEKAIHYLEMLLEDYDA